MSSSGRTRPARLPRTWRPSRGARDSRPTSRRRGRASPGSRSARRPTSRGRRRRRRSIVAPPVPQHDPLVDDELGHVLVRRADEDLLDPRVVARSARRPPRDRVVGLELDHRPQDDAERLDGRLGDRELGEQLGRHPGRRLVAREEVVAERLDDPVRGAADVRRALLAQQEQELVAQPGHARQRDPVAPEDRRPRREMRPEQLVGRVDEVEAHRRPARARGRSSRNPSRPARAALQVRLEDRAPRTGVIDQRAEVRRGPAG